MNLKSVSAVSFVKATDEELAAFKTLKTFHRLVYIHFSENSEIEEETVILEFLLINYLDENFGIFLHTDNK